MDEQHRSARGQGTGSQEDQPTAPLRPTAFGSPEYAEPGFPTAPGPERRGRGTGRVGWVIAAACLVIIGVGGGYLAVAGVSGGSAGNAVAASTQSAPMGTVAAAPDAEGPPPGTRASGGDATDPGGTAPTGSSLRGSLSSLGGAAAKLGLPTPSGANAALGVVASIDGDSFVVRTLDGNEDDVLTDDHTYFITVRGTGGISALAVGDLVFVGGEDTGDGGAIKADMVLGGTFPELGSATR